MREEIEDTIEWETLEITSRKLELPREHFMKIWARWRREIDLTETEDIKRWQEYTEELYKKDLHNPDNHNGVITHLVPDNLECEVKWALGSITTEKASGCDGISVEPFHILKDDAVKVLPAYLENSAVAIGLEKVSFHSNPQKKQCQRKLKLLHNCTHLTH